MKHKYYFSNVATSTDYDIDHSLVVILVPSNWWSVTAWKLAFEFNRNVECVYLGTKKVVLK